MPWLLDAIDAKAKAALAILPEFDKGLGRRKDGPAHPDETGAMSAKEWSSAFTPEDSEGHAVPPEDVPLMITITKKRPAYQRFFIRGLDGVRRHVEVASIPIAGLDGDFLGGAALFWEVSD